MRKFMRKLKSTLILLHERFNVFLLDMKSFCKDYLFSEVGIFLKNIFSIKEVIFFIFLIGIIQFGVNGSIITKSIYFIGKIWLLIIPAILIFSYIFIKHIYGKRGFSEKINYILRILAPILLGYLYLNTFSSISVDIRDALIKLCQKYSHYDYAIQYLLFYSDLRILLSMSVFSSLVIFTTVLVLLSIFSRTLSRYFYDLKTPDKKILLIDKPLTGAKFDQLGMSVHVDKFITILENNRSSAKSISIESPWGTGKTTFINFLKEREKIKNHYLVYDFNPWIFHSERDLLKTFLTGLSEKIQQEYSRPKLGSLIDKLISQITYSSKEFWGMKIENINPFSGDKDLIKTRDDIKEVIRSLDKQILIIVDDLDRITFEKIKIVFQVLELSKLLGVTYIVCFDSDNFNSIEQPTFTTHNFATKDNGGLFELENKEEQILNNKAFKEYIHKLFTVKFILPIGINEIKNYFLETFTKLPNKNHQYSAKSISGIEAGIEILFLYENFRIYCPYITNIRSIKRIYNALILLYNQRMDELVNIFDRSLELGLYFENFIKVLIIYIYHDKIYSEIDYEWQLSKKESWGKDAFKFTPGFDWGGSGNGHQVRYQERLREYLKTLPEEGVKILKNILEIPKEVTKAFSPGHDERKLYNEWDRYLSPFTFVANLNQTATVNKNIELLREGNKKIEEIYRDLEPEFFLELIYAFEKIPDSKAREQELPNGIFEKLIDFMMDNFHKESMNKFSFFANELVHILDNMVPYSNHYKNCLFISDYLYGRAKYLKKGILKKFFNNEWGIKGLLNALEIGDTLSEAGLSLFNFRRGAGESDEMNQDPSYYSVIYDLRLFNLFKKKYISGNINIFAEIDILTDDDFAGFSNETNLPHRRNISRNFLRFFIPYQIGSTHEMGKLSIKPLYKARPIELGGDIHEQMRKYLLDKCFSGDKGSDYFIDFVFSFISPVRSYRGNDDNEVITYELRQNELFSIIEKNYIEAYMTTNEAKINKYLKTKRLSHSTYQVGKTLSITYRECFYIFKNALEKS